MIDYVFMKMFDVLIHVYHMSYSFDDVPVYEAYADNPFARNTMR